MRSRREEFVKRFEELTKQEIKNYNDSLLHTHTSMEEFRGKLKGCVDLYAQQVAKLSSETKGLQSENRDLKKQMAILSKRLDSQLSDINRLENDKIVSDKAHDHDFEHESLEREMVSHALRRFESQTVNEFIILKKCIDSINLGLERIYNFSKSDNEKMKNDILSMPSEAKKVKEELLKKASETAVDNAGIVKEILVYKKTVFVLEKKIERLFTLIERLEEKISTLGGGTY